MFKIDNVLYYERRDILKGTNIDNHLWGKILYTYQIRPHVFKTKEGLKYGYDKQQLDKIISLLNLNVKFM